MSRRAVTSGYMRVYLTCPIPKAQDLYVNFGPSQAKRRLKGSDTALRKWLEAATKLELG